MKNWKKFTHVKRLIACALCLATIATVFASCDKGTPSSEDKIESEKSTDLQMLVSGVDANQTSQPAIKAMNKFKEQYKRDVEFVTCGYDEWNQKVNASIASGAPIDVVSAGTYQYPLFAMKKFSQPIDDLVDLKSENIDLNVMKSLFTYQGKYYNAAPAGASLPLMIYYNKDLFESNGFDDPYELYQKDEWTTEKFKEIAKAFTKDTNNDGAYDQWGLCAWYQWVFFGSSAASVCKINDAGEYELNLDNNPALNEALELIKSGWYDDKWIGLEGSDIYDSFYKGKNAMINEFTWAGKTIMEEKTKGTFAFQVGAVPFPYGAQNTERMNYCFSDGFSILNGAGAPYSAGKLIDMILTETVENAKNSIKVIPDEWQEMYKELQKKPFNSSYFDSAIDSGKDLCGLVGSGKSLQQAYEIIKPKYQSLINEANKKEIEKIERDFTTIDLSFANDIAGIKKASETASLAVSHDPAKSALKLEMKTNTYGETCPAMQTVPKEKPVVGWKGYKISFDYMVEKIPNATLTGYTTTIGFDGVDSSSQDVLVPEEAALKDFVHYEFELDGVSSNSEDMYITIGGYYADTIWIKNFKVEEIKK